MTKLNWENTWGKVDWKNVTPEEIKRLLVECAHVDEDEVTLEANLKKDLGIDSIRENNKWYWKY